VEFHATVGHHLDAENLAHLLGQQAALDVGATAGPERNDELDRLFGEIRPCRQDGKYRHRQPGE
jgi:hypothetical protein